jgi:hypothetical protein
MEDWERGSLDSLNILARIVRDTLISVRIHEETC